MLDFRRRARGRRRQPCRLQWELPLVTILPWKSFTLGPWFCIGNQAKWQKIHFEMQLCADLPGTSRGVLCWKWGLWDLIKTFVRRIFDHPSKLLFFFYGFLPDVDKTLKITANPTKASILRVYSKFFRFALIRTWNKITVLDGARKFVLSKS